MKIPQKLKIELPYNSAISLLGGYLKKMKRPIQKYIYTSMFIVALFIFSFGQSLFIYLFFDIKKPYFILFYWSIVDLQCCVSFRCAAK